jgi:hypothetical protein
MNMIAFFAEGATETFECLRCGHLQTRLGKDGPTAAISLSGAAKIKRFRDKAAETLQLANLAETEVRRTTLMQIATYYRREADQLEQIAKPKSVSGR